MSSASPSSILLGIIVKASFFYLKGYGKAYCLGISEGLKSRKKLDKIRLKNNNKVYRNIEKELLIGMFKLVKERISR